MNKIRIKLYDHGTLEQFFFYPGKNHKGGICLSVDWFSSDTLNILLEVLLENGILDLLLWAIQLQYKCSRSQIRSAWEVNSIMSPLCH